MITYKKGDVKHMNEKKYFLGLDIGTDSIGWAVTDEEYNLEKVRGNYFWGSFLYEEAKSKAERRNFRSARYRLKRVHERLMLLQSLFVDEITKIDPTFFIRLNNSKLMLEDKNEQIKTKSVLFNDVGYTDKEFYKEYKTIFHLRKALIEKSCGDVRHLYLALHHIIKNRGHFLFEGQNFNVSSFEVAKIAITEINNYFADKELPTLSLENIDEALEIIKDNKLGKRDKQTQLKKLFAIENKDKHLTSTVALITGAKTKLKDLYGLEDNYLSFDFTASDFEERILPDIEREVGFDESFLIHKIKSVYDWSVLTNILKGYKYISEAKVAVYDEHQKDLKLLKEYVIKNRDRETYKLIFRHSDKVNNYAAYIGMDKNKGYKKAKREDFYKFLKNTVKIDDELILERIEREEFLPKQISALNGVIPYQVHYAELDAILKMAEKRYDFLKTESDGYSVSDKIRLLMTFRVPYYVGRMSGKNAWAVRKAGMEGVKITPWNFEKVVDLDKSEENFIRNMTLKCTYLKTEDVLPKSSLLYSEFMFLNELNNLTIYGKKDNRARLLIYEYAKNHKRVTLKNCLGLLRREGYDIPQSAKPSDVFGGIDGEFKNNLSSYVEFNDILGGKIESKREMCEEIIKLITIISDKNRLIKRIKSRYSTLSDEQLKRIKGLSYSAWGRFSRALLEDVKSQKFVDEETGELLSIIEAMRKYSLNFMELLSKANGFSSAIEEFNSEFKDEKITYKTVEELYCSPLVKRAIWRTVVLVKEIVKIKGKAPEKVFIEVARGGTEEQKKRGKIPSRKEQILALYKSIKSDARDWYEEIESRDERIFSSDKVYLYYSQMGKCMYTGEPIEFEDIFNTNIYDIDHIYPQSKIKDDSLDNRVLVKKQYNQFVKKDIYPLPESDRVKMRAYWEMLRSLDLISQKKFDRLIRNTSLTTDELADFINRQLVVTQQSTKEVANILKRLLPNTEIVYSKAKAASEFKNRYNLVKVRELNDLHHAKDAYINIVVGNVYNVKFGHDARVYYSKADFSNVNLEKLFDYDLKGAWKVDYIGKVKDAYKIDRVRTVRFTNEEMGKLFDATLQTKGDADKLIPLKKSGAISDTTKYGGYISAKGAYFSLVKSVGKKDKVLLSLEQIPIYIVKSANGDKSKIIEFLEKECGLIKPEILIEKIKKNTLFEINGSKACIRGRTGNQITWQNANQLFLDYGLTVYLKRITSFFAKEKKTNKIFEVQPEFDKINSDSNLKLYDELVSKLASHIYSGLSISGQTKFLQEKRDVFINRSLREQCVVLMEIVALMQCNVVLSDFSLLEGKSNVGSNKLSKFIQDSSVKIIYQSPTGHYKTVIDIKKFL